ncbi:hypothetical protein B0H11DRAFT_1942044 [Mycena galericulata]|nr:hypothetical protein B0H11DRAFT_1942044 [Mycena galericulata]
MAPTRMFKTPEDYLRYLTRLETYRNYRQKHREKCRAKGRERMARVHAAPTDAQRARHREAQARYRERFREEIAHRARRAAVKKNAAAGKETKLRPKARQYWSADELDSDDSEEEEDDCSAARRRRSRAWCCAWTAAARRISSRQLPRPKQGRVPKLCPTPYPTPSLHQLRQVERRAVAGAMRHSGRDAAQRCAALRLRQRLRGALAPDSAHGTALHSCGWRSDRATSTGA